MTATVFALSLTVCGAAQSLDRPWERPDGVIEFKGQTFKSWRAYHESPLFDPANKCAAPDPAANNGGQGQVGAFRGISVDDCTMSSTTIDADYDPTVGDYRIPCVVHVIRNSSGTSGDITFDKVESGIRILNEDINALAGSLGENGNFAGIEFYLADVDPDGNQTNGVTFSNNDTWYNDGGNYWESLAWDPQRYLNIYTTTAGGALGYVAGFPADGTAGQIYDRVVILWSTYGEDAPYGAPYNYGRTLTHEVGHYLGLFHTFQGGCGSSDCYNSSDLICDTNDESGPNFSCSGSPSSTCGSEDPIDNYMDYSDDLCMEQFTAEQVNRMRCSLLNYRPLLYTEGASCSTGIAGFGSAAVQPDSTVTVSVRDCDINTDENSSQSLTVDVSSDFDAPFSLTLNEEGLDSAVFSATINISSIPGGQGLYAPEGSEIMVEYLDELDADENPNVTVLGVARVDGSVNGPLSVDVVSLTSSTATVAVSTDEPVQVTVNYGLSCDVLSGSESQAAFATDSEVTITGLEDGQSYFYVVVLTDEAGNSGTYGAGKGCYEVDIPEAPDFFTEQFASGFDLQNTSLEFTRESTLDVFGLCGESIGSFPYDTSGGTPISLGDDTSEGISLPFTFEYYGQNYDTAYVGSNGYVTFSSGDTTYTETIDAHFSLPRISMLFDDLNPSTGSGSVTYTTSSDLCVITWDNVNEYSTSNSNSFQVALHASGDITMSWLGIDVQDAIVGLSRGGGVDPDYEGTDLTAGTSGCLPGPPSAFDVSVSTLPGVPVEITLSASDDGQPSPFVYVIESLPQQGILRDLGLEEVISVVPHVIASGPGPHVEYESTGNFEGTVAFNFSADDGGTPPEGGPSNSATVQVVVATGPQVIVAWPMDSDPGWTLEGDWAWGVPAGAGGDPSSGATGSNVVGYNLNGDYTNNMSETYATTPSIDCSASVDTTLRFKRWLGIESSTFDHASVQVSGGGEVWTTVYDHVEGGFQETSWSDIEIDISEVADGSSDVRIRWVMGTTDGSVTYGGWNIDDVELIGVVPNDSVPGDFNGDGLVNGADFGIMLAAWGECSGCPEDLNEDGFVSGADVGLLLTLWN